MALPTSDTFSGTRVGGDPETFQISCLDRATVDENGSVELTDGACLYGVDVIPTAICRELTDIQKQIVYLTNARIGAEDTCYRGLPDGLLPGWRSLDYSALYGLKLPSLEAIALPIAATPQG